MKVAAILKTKGEHVVTTPPDTMISTIAWELRSRGIGALVVSQDGVTRADHRTRHRPRPGRAWRGAVADARRSGDDEVGNHMCAGDSVTRVMAEMTRHRVRHIPVIEGGKLRGIVSIGDVVKHRLDELQLEANVLRQVYIVSH